MWVQVPLPAPLRKPDSVKLRAEESKMPCHATHRGCLARGATARKGAAHLKRSFAELRQLNLAQLGDYVVELQFHAAVDEREAHAQRVTVTNRFRRS